MTYTAKRMEPYGTADQNHWCQLEARSLCTSTGPTNLWQAGFSTVLHCLRLIFQPKPNHVQSTRIPTSITLAHVIPSCLYEDFPDFPGPYLPGDDPNEIYDDYTGAWGSQMPTYTNTQRDTGNSELVRDSTMKAAGGSSNEEGPGVKGGRDNSNSIVYIK